MFIQGGAGSGPAYLRGGPLVVNPPQYIPTNEVPDAESFLESFKSKAKGAGTKAKEALKGAVKPMSFAEARRFGAGRLGITGGLLAGGLTAVDALQQGRPLEAAAGGAGAALGTVGGTVLGGMVGGPVGAFIGGSLGSMLGGQAGTAAEYAKREITGDPITGKDDLKNQLAQLKKRGELDNLLYRNTLGTYTSALTDLNQNYMDQQYTQAQRMLPLINKMQDQQLVRQQALINTQGQQAAMLGTLATAGALAQGAQRETGALLRTALSTNPYAGSVAQAPQIRFG